jgi:hypothetical protein
MKLSIAITSLLAVSFAAVAKRSHLENGKLGLIGGREGMYHQSRLKIFNTDIF